MYTVLVARNLLLCWVLVWVELRVLSSKIKDTPIRAEQLSGSRVMRNEAAGTMVVGGQEWTRLEWPLNVGNPRRPQIPTVPTSYHGNTSLGLTITDRCGPLLTLLI